MHTVRRKVSTARALALIGLTGVIAGWAAVASATSTTPGTTPGTAAGGITTPGTTAEGGERRSVANRSGPWPAPAILRTGWTSSSTRLTNANGMDVKIITYGGIIHRSWCPTATAAWPTSRSGSTTSIEYVHGHPYFGCIAGRYANRIAGGTFTLDGETYQLATNNGPNTPPRRRHGFDKSSGRRRRSTSGDGVGVRLSRTSPDGEEGYPGTWRSRSPTR